MKIWLQSLLMLITMTLITGVGYPLLVTAMAQFIWPYQSNGSLVIDEKGVRGSELIAQYFQHERYFWSRPLNVSNQGPLSTSLKQQQNERRILLSTVHGGSPVSVPVDLVSGSASGLDPDISEEAALYQINRVAKARRLTVQQVSELKSLIEQHTEGSKDEMLGLRRVNVLKLNMLIDRHFGA